MVQKPDDSDGLMHLLVFQSIPCVLEFTCLCIRILISAHVQPHFKNIVGCTGYDYQKHYNS